MFALSSFPHLDFYVGSSFAPLELSHTDLSLRDDIASLLIGVWPTLMQAWSTVIALPNTVIALTSHARDLYEEVTALYEEVTALLQLLFLLFEKEEVFCSMMVASVDHELDHRHQ